MKILHVIPSYLPAVRYGGPVQAAHGLCASLVRLGHEVHVFTTNIDGSVKIDVPLGKPTDKDGVKIWYFDSSFLKQLYFSNGMRKALREKVLSFDLLHLHSIYNWPTWTAARLAERNRVPYLIAPRGMLIQELIQRKNRWFKTFWIRLIEKRTLEKASGIHATSGLEAEELKRFDFKFPRVFIVPNGVNDDLIDHKPPSSEIVSKVQKLTGKRPFVLFLGRLNWKKGIDRLIRAMQYLSGVPLIIAGNDDEGYQKVMDRMIHRFKVHDKIRILGPVYGESKRALLKSATLLALPSYSENFGNVVLEAMSVGTPVVVTPEVGLADVVRDGKAGIVTRGEPEDLASAMKHIFTQPEERKKMGQAATLIVQNQFRWNSIAQQIIRIYEEVVIR